MNTELSEVFLGHITLMKEKFQTIHCRNSKDQFYWVINALITQYTNLLSLILLGIISHHLISGFVILICLFKNKNIYRNHYTSDRFTNFKKFWKNKQNLGNKHKFKNTSTLFSCSHVWKILIINWKIYKVFCFVFVLKVGWDTLSP